MDEETPDPGMIRAGNKPPVGESERDRLVRRFIEGHWSQLRSLAARLVGGAHAEDVAQEACLNLVERLVQRPSSDVIALLRSPTDLHKLMCRITACRAYDHLRRRQLQAGAPAHDGGETDDSVVDGTAPERLLTAMDVERVARAYATLTPAQRIVHVLHHYYGFTDADFQVTLGLSKSNSRTLVSRANRALKRALERKS
jgi:RNA polymerase sigma factor (sigma-70 family)